MSLKSESWMVWLCPCSCSCSCCQGCKVAFRFFFFHKPAKNQQNNRHKPNELYEVELEVLPETTRNWKKTTTTTEIVSSIWRNCCWIFPLLCEGVVVGGNHEASLSIVQTSLEVSNQMFPGTMPVAFAWRFCCRLVVFFLLFFCWDSKLHHMTFGLFSLFFLFLCVLKTDTMKKSKTPQTVIFAVKKLMGFGFHSPKE